jgi:acetyl-CoA acetyltransferase
MPEASLRGRAAIVGIGESTYHRHGQADRSQFELTLEAVLRACEDAGLEPSRIDGFCSYANDHNGPTRLAAAMDVDELRWSVMQWEGGGGGMAAAIGNAAAGIALGQAEHIVVLRGLAQGQFGRFGRSRGRGEVSARQAFTAPYGVSSPGQVFALVFRRWMHEHGGVGLAAQKAISLASYHHAQANPRAVMYGRPLTSEAYDEARPIVEPWRLYDCCQESDGAAALVLSSPDRAGELTEHPVHVLGVAQGSARGWGRSVMNSPEYANANLAPLASRLWREAGLSPTDVDVVQCYENFTGGVVMALVEHGFCDADEVDEVLTFDDLLAPAGRLPLNTAGGNLAEAYIHGLNLAVEAVRQLRGEAVNQVPSARVSLVAAGPMTAPASTLLLGTSEVL